jgi:MFS family permease
MRAFWWDGVLSEASEVVWFQYLSVYLLFLGASAGLIGVIASLTSLASAVSTVPGAAVAESTGRHKSIVLVSTTAGRAVFLVLAVMPWLGNPTITMAVLVAACLLRGGLSSFAAPAWNAVAAEAVPPHVRGRYFAFRNWGKQGTMMLLTPVVGQVLAVAGGASGWQLLWLTSAGIGLGASLCFMRMPPPSKRRVEEVASAPLAPTKPSMRQVLQDVDLLRFVGTTSLFQLSVMIAGPFFTVYLVQDMGASPFWIGMVATASPLTAMLCQPILGPIADRLRPEKLLVYANTIIVLTPVAWLFATDPWHIVAVNLVGGAAWQANQLGSFNFLLAIAPERRLPSYSAAHQLGLFAVTFIGPITGGLIIGIAGFPTLFVLSAAGRALATVLQQLLLLRVKPPTVQATASIPNTSSLHELPPGR